MDIKTKQALEFLSDKNPLFEFWDRKTYVFKLMDYIENKGEDAIQSLAGFYVWCISNLEEEKRKYMISTTFAHDLGQQEDKLMLPRSSEYLEFWNEYTNKNIINEA